jgi:enamine deaminase RidA (YjgF/YER057c/UK114 family)
MATRIGNLIYTAGHLPVTPQGVVITGKVGSELTTEQGYDAARAVGLNLLATLRSELGGDLGRVRRVVKLTAFVNCVDSFAAQPKVVNGCSELMGEVFGEAGKHARSAVGVNALPLNVPVEIEAIVEVE